MSEPRYSVTGIRTGNTAAEFASKLDALAFQKYINTKAGDYHEVFDRHRGEIVRSYPYDYRRP